LVSSTCISQGTGNPADEDQLELLIQCHRNNAARGTIRKLLFGNGTYLQFLEGEPADVDQRIAKIDADPRQAVIKILSREPITTRQCVDWNVGLSKLPNEPLTKFRARGVVGSATSNPNTSREAAQRLTPCCAGLAEPWFFDWRHQSHADSRRFGQRPYNWLTADQPAQKRLRWPMRLRQHRRDVSYSIRAQVRTTLPAVENRPEPGCHTPALRSSGHVSRDAKHFTPENHRFGGCLNLGFRSLATQQTDVCKAVDAQQAIRNHVRHKHLGHAIEPTHDHLVTATPRSQPKRILAQSACACATESQSLQSVCANSSGTVDMPHEVFCASCVAAFSVTHA
jgi:hypothetical protein